MDIAAAKTGAVDVNKCECGAQICARCGACRKEARELYLNCRAWGRIYQRHIWKWEPNDV